MTKSHVSIFWFWRFMNPRLISLLFLLDNPYVDHPEVLNDLYLGGETADVTSYGLYGFPRTEPSQYVKIFATMPETASKKQIVRQASGVSF